ncbi:MAG: Lipoprotein-releasing system ATP-binding protein LolD [Phycisphaerae bacterium]|nr:Lipoprotein-releasing system ATP-binding protein LolD [Phycisphaerae bacterium]
MTQTGTRAVAPPPAAGPMVTAENLTRTYIKGAERINAIDGVNLTVAPGEFLAINGPSGSGKTTLLFALAGLIRPTSGTVRVAGVEVSSQSPAATARFRAEHIGFIFQTFYLVPYLTAAENVMLAQTASGSGADAAAAGELLSRIGLGERLRHKPSELSAGEQQRVAFARAVVNRPPLLLGDEPTGNLDQKRGREILELIADYNRGGGTVILVTHSDTVTEFASRRIDLVDGRIMGG